MRSFRIAAARKALKSVLTEAAFNVGKDIGVLLFEAENCPNLDYVEFLHDRVCRRLDGFRDTLATMFPDNLDLIESYVEIVDHTANETIEELRGKTYE